MSLIMTPVNGLEPGAERLSTSYDSNRNKGLMSIAISLKRIADALEAANQPKIDYSNLKAT
jgi:hypothetical protein